jgi:hypothetical protein
MKVYAQEYKLIEKESESVQQNVLMFFEIIWMACRLGWYEASTLCAASFSHASDY